VHDDGTIKLHLNSKAQRLAGNQSLDSLSMLYLWNDSESWSCCRASPNPTRDLIMKDPHLKPRNSPYFGQVHPVRGKIQTNVDAYRRRINLTPWRPHWESQALHG